MQVFGGAAGALAAMTVLSALMGWAAPTLVSCQTPSHAACSFVLTIAVRADIQTVHSIWSSSSILYLWIQDAL